MRALVNAKVIKTRENPSKKEDFKKEYPYVAELLLPDIIEGDKVFIPNSFVPSKINLEKGDQLIEVKIQGSNNYELRIFIEALAEKQKGKGA